MIIYQKAIVIGGISCVSFSNGYTWGQITGMVSSLRRGEDGIQLTVNQISLIASSIMMISIFGMGMVAIVSDRIGRRVSFMVFSIPSIINWIILYYANDMFEFMLSRVLAGIGAGALLALKLCVTSEYTGPKTRAMFLNIISTLMPSIGAGVGHALGIILHWRTVALIGIIPSVFGILIPYFWVESPHWLASKGRFEECANAFRTLHGSSPLTETELELLIRVETMKLKNAQDTNSIKTLKKLLIAFRKKYFWDLMLLSVFISAFMAAVEKVAFSALAITIIEGITGSSDVLYFTLVVDLAVVIGAGTSCILIRTMSMRTMLFTTSVISISVLISLSASLYFAVESVYFQWANVALFAFYFFIIKAGPYPILEALLGEIYPLELKVHCFFLSGTVLMGAMSLTIVLLPISVAVIGYHGLFLLNSSIMCVSLAYIWMRLPETKGRTLQEIEIYFKTKAFDNIDKMLNNEQLFRLNS